MQKLPKSVHWSGYYNNLKSQIPQNLTLRNRERKLFSYSPQQQAGACSKHLLMTFINFFFFFCVIRSIISDTKKTGQSDFAKNPKSKYLKLPLKISHNEKVAQYQTHFERQGHKVTCYMVLEQWLHRGGSSKIGIYAELKIAALKFSRLHGKT